MDSLCFIVVFFVPFFKPLEHTKKQYTTADGKLAELSALPIQNFPDLR